jgi:hypothetical protein
MSQANHPDAIISTERVFSVPRRRVFAASEQPDQLARWWGPKDFTNSFEQSWSCRGKSAGSIRNSARLIVSTGPGSPDGRGGLDADQRSLGNELSIAHLRYQLEERPDHECAITPPRDLIDAPPSVSTEAWDRARRSAWGFGSSMRVKFGRTRTRHLGFA